MDDRTVPQLALVTPEWAAEESPYYAAMDDLDVPMPVLMSRHRRRRALTLLVLRCLGYTEDAPPSAAPTAACHRTLSPTKPAVAAPPAVADVEMETQSSDAAGEPPAVARQFTPAVMLPPGAAPGAPQRLYAPAFASSYEPPAVARQFTPAAMLPPDVAPSAPQRPSATAFRDRPIDLCSDSE